uniref:UBX domain-containing protein n=2 Tax=Oryza TaxID=4527 RepID=A0A0D3G1H9_9ORYZ
MSISGLGMGPFFPSKPYSPQHLPSPILYFPIASHRTFALVSSYSPRTFPLPLSPTSPTLLAVPPNPTNRRAREGPIPDFAAMAGAPPTEAEKESLVTSFLEIAAGQTPETATQFLQMTSWHLEEALQLFYIDGEAALAAHPAPSPAAAAEAAAAAVAAAAEVEDAMRFAPPPAAALGDGMLQGLGEEEDVRAPLPTKRETLYGDAPMVVVRPNSTVAFRNFEEESRQSAVWDSEQNAASSSRDNLAALYRPPFALMFNGPFDKAKLEASVLDKWLLINLQSTEEFSSHMLNRDTWANEAVAQTIRSNFIFWQVYHDTSEGRKVCTYYNLVSVPAILLIDPITGQKMRGWNGMIHPDRLLEDLMPYLDKGPKEHHAAQPQKRPRKVDQETSIGKQGKTPVPVVATEDEDEELARAVAASLEESKGSDTSEEKIEPEVENETSLSAKLNYPPLPEEPKGSRELLCRVAIRLPDGRRIQRNFLHTDPIKLLWSFCYPQVEDGDKKAFHFVQPIPRASTNLEYESDKTFKEAGLANSMINLLWD